MSGGKSIPISPEALEAFRAVPLSNPAIQAASENTEDESGTHYPITVLSGFCTRLAGSTCNRCVQVCPYGAISITEDAKAGSKASGEAANETSTESVSNGRPSIDANYCTRCALCCGVCDAFVTKRITMNDQLEKVARLSSEGDPVFFTCYDQIPEDFEVHPQVITLPCLGAVSPEFWAAALSITPNIQIYCNFSLCENCPTAGANARSLFIHAVNLGEQWSQVHMGSAKRLPEKADILSRFFDATSEEFQRRGVAKSLVGEVEDIATGKHRRQYSNTISDFYARKDHMRARGHATNLQYHAHIPSTAEQPIKKQWPRLCMIAKAVQENPEMAPRIPRYFAAIDYSACKKCYKPCFSHCPAGARAVGAEGIITVDPLLCIACGNCARYCPEEAAYLYETNASIFLPEASE